jgi:hypothetical protein
VEYLASLGAAEVAAETGDCTLEFAAASSALTLEQKVDKTTTAKMRAMLNMMSPEIQKSLLPPLSIPAKRSTCPAERFFRSGKKLPSCLTDRASYLRQMGSRKIEWPLLQGNSHIPRYIAA